MALLTIWVWTGLTFVSKLVDPAKLPKTQLGQGFYAGASRTETEYPREAQARLKTVERIIGRIG